jgi:hypothetical protein
MILIAIATLRTPTILSRLCASSTAVKSITPMVFTTLTRTPADAIFTINGSALNVLSTAASQIRMAPTRLAMGAAALTALRGTMLPSVVRVHQTLAVSSQTWVLENQILALAMTLKLGLSQFSIMILVNRLAGSTVHRFTTHKLPRAQLRRPAHV